MSSDHVVIRSRKKVVSDSLSHGGWKVAMADLMISMMCLFLILWLLSVMDSQDQEQLINYFAEGELQQPVHGEGLGNSVSPIALPNVATSRNESDLHRIEDTSLIEGDVSSQQQLELLAKVINHEVSKVDGGDGVDVTVTPQGLKLVISDSNQGAMFYRSSSRMTPYYQDLLLNLAPIFQKISNSMIITGHTDSSQFKGSNVTNWELSANRANSARYYFNSGGVPEEHIFQVTGMAATAPLNPQDTRSADNRRIEVFVLTKDAKETLQSIYKGEDPAQLQQEKDAAALNQFDSHARGAQRQALQNQPTSAYERL